MAAIDDFEEGRQTVPLKENDHPAAQHLRALLNNADEEPIGQSVWSAQIAAHAPWRDAGYKVPPRRYIGVDIGFRNNGVASIIVAKDDDDVIHFYLEPDRTKTTEVWPGEITKVTEDTLHRRVKMWFNKHWPDRVTNASALWLIEEPYFIPFGRVSSFSHSLCMLDAVFSSHLRGQGVLTLKQSSSDVKRKHPEIFATPVGARGSNHERNKAAILAWAKNIIWYTPDGVDNVRDGPNLTWDDHIADAAFLVYHHQRTWNPDAKIVWHVAPSDAALSYVDTPVILR